MHLTFFKQIIRSLIRRKVYSAINIAGLGIGLGCTILMAIYIIHEFSFDRYHAHASDLFRVIVENDCDTYYAMGEAFRNEIPEIESVCRLFDIESVKVKQGVQFVEEDKIIFSDPTLLTMLDIEIFSGSPEKQMGTIGFFSTIALALSIMGLLGFVALNLVKRTKEIGIRKINGADTGELLKMMNLQYVKWIITALCIAWPLGYFAMSKWLENFAYKTSLSWWVFAIAGVIALGIALLTVSWQSWRAASRNPVEALRYE
jgi:hypothetical protein